MEKAEITREIEETEQEEEEIEDLQARRSTKLPNNLNPNHIKEDDDNDDYKQHKSANTNGEVEDDVHLIPTSIQELKTIDNGGIDVSEAELYQQVDFDNSVKCTGITTELSSNGHSGTEHTDPGKIDGDCVADVTKSSLNIGTGEFLSQESELEHAKQHGSLSGSSLSPSEISVEEDKTSLNFSNYIAIHSTETDQLYASDHHEATELDVERVLRKQDTHDLYCPNCNSCITKRVIIRKRKRRLPNLGEDGKRNKLENVTGPGPISTSVPTTSDPSHNTVDNCVDDSGALASNNIDQVQEPDVFRCLSCFSIFIPSGNGFKLFRMIRDKSDEDNLQDPPQTQVLKKSWFSTLFQSDKRVITSADVETDDTEVLIPSKSTRQQNGSVSSMHVSSSHAYTDLNGEPVKSSNKESVEGGTDNISPQKISLAEPGSINNCKDQVSMNLNEENGEASPNKSPSHEIYTDEGSVWSEISGSKEGGTNVLSPSYYEAPLNRQGEHPEITLADIPPTSTREAAELSTFKPQENGLKFFIPFGVSSITVETSKTDQKVNGTIPNKGSDEKDTAFLLQTPLSFLEESFTDSKVNVTLSISPQNEQIGGASLLSEFATQIKFGEVTTNNKDYRQTHTKKAEAYTDEPLKADQTAPIPVIQNNLLLHGRQINLRNTFKDTAAQKGSVSDTIMVVATSQTEDPDAQRVQDLTNPAETENLQHLETRIQINEQSDISAEGIRGLEIIKSIVYGGLVESISSLGVVSSAAGSDAATLNVLALGLATLIGGLIIIGHNLWELENDKKTEASDHLDKRVDRYHELLGHRRNFLLHAVFAVLSFLTFGLIPPITYGFSFRSSDDRNLKLVMVAASSLSAIIILACGKAYVKRTPKSYMKTVLYCVMMGLMVSGISYEAGNLINMFLKKLDVFHSSFVVTQETRVMKPGWASY
ncbi:membrane protein of ER body-like protein isoform X2 [Daucus carota subsp. sativus]|uniref:membrane protein of ER body-like protein isoform X2 n=1 Tax=Daucus carota subsp. sativus TaxID=79200 RepID=UPI0007EEF7E1|nr:PREDICTED: membrane protein of ER body-like protein isoform X2 [Daucus carota subsp. sativus]